MKYAFNIFQNKYFLVNAYVLCGYEQFYIYDIVKGPCCTEQLRKKGITPSCSRMRNEAGLCLEFRLCRFCFNKSLIIKPGTPHILMCQFLFHCSETFFMIDPESSRSRPSIIFVKLPFGVLVVLDTCKVSSRIHFNVCTIFRTLNQY